MHDDFDPNAAPGPDAGIFGLPYARERCRLVLVPVPWDLTTSFSRPNFRDYGFLSFRAAQASRQDSGEVPRV